MQALAHRAAHRADGPRPRCQLASGRHGAAPPNPKQPALPPPRTMYRRSRTSCRTLLPAPASLPTAASVASALLRNRRGRGPSRVHSGSRGGRAGPSPCTIASRLKWLHPNSRAWGGGGQGQGEVVERCCWHACLQGGGGRHVAFQASVPASCFPAPSSQMNGALIQTTGPLQPNAQDPRTSGWREHCVRGEGQREGRYTPARPAAAACTRRVEQANQDEEALGHAATVPSQQPVEVTSAWRGGPTTTPRRSIPALAKQ